MGRGRGFRVPAVLGLLAVLAAPAALADTTAPVQGDAWYDYQADAAALLARVRAYDPTFHLTFTFAEATLYELQLQVEPPGPGKRAASLDALAPLAPASVHVRHLGAGSLALDPGRDATLLLASDPRGLSASLPLRPAEPGRLVADLERSVPALLEGGVRPGEHTLTLDGALAYAAEGLAVEQPVRVRAQGGVLAVVTRGLALVEDAQGSSSHALAPGSGRALVVVAKGADALLEARGLTAVVHVPEASAAAGAQAVADLQGKEVAAEPEARVSSGPEHLGVAADASLARLLGGEGAVDPVLGTSGAGPAPAGPDAGQRAAAAALLGGAVALAAAGIAGLLAGGKAGLFALLAPLYARLQNDEILRNEAREGIFRFIVENPGANVSEVVKRFHLGWGATVYHLRVLERNHLVVASKQGRQVCYFQNGGRYTGQMSGVSVLRNANAARVAATVLASPGAQQREICRLTGLAQPTVSWHLRRLEESALVAAEGGARKRYRPLQVLEELARRGLVPGYAPRPRSAVAPSAATPTTPTTA